jgi:hypothetical protein
VTETRGSTKTVWRIRGSTKHALNSEHCRRPTASKGLSLTCLKLPPWIQIITGALVAPAGAKMLAYRQSSDVVGGHVWGGRAQAWGQPGASEVASSAFGPQASTGAVGAQRRSPTGGAANGTPRNTFTCPLVEPVTGPSGVVMVTGAASEAAAAHKSIMAERMVG